VSVPDKGDVRHGSRRNTDGRKPEGGRGDTADEPPGTHVNDTTAAAIKATMVTATAASGGGRTTLMLIPKSNINHFLDIF